LHDAAGQPEAHEPGVTDLNARQRAFASVDVGQITCAKDDIAEAKTWRAGGAYVDTAKLRLAHDNVIGSNRLTPIILDQRCVKFQMAGDKEILDGMMLEFGKVWQLDHDYGSCGKAMLGVSQTAPGLSATRRAVFQAAPASASSTNASAGLLSPVARDPGRPDCWQTVGVPDPSAVLGRFVEAVDRDRLATGSAAPYERYGLGVWDGPGDCWRLDGRYGQYVIVDQQLDAVITITGHEESRDHLLAEHAARALHGT
jgi:hypothetical protein